MEVTNKNKNFKSEEETYYQRTRNKQRYDPSLNLSRSEHKASNSLGNQLKPTKKGRNPADKYGNITQCHICCSINHWANNCPDRDLDNNKPTKEAYYNIVM